jgi:uncharacterized protein YndB with AHSA1/START domain
VFETCPTDVVEAPAETVWRLLTEPRELDGWLDAKLVDGPDRTLASADVLRFRTGPLTAFGVRWTVREVQPPHTLGLFIELPLGITNDAVIHLSPMGAGRCRVTFQ